MKLFSLFFVLIISNSFAQTETDAFKKVADEFESSYNSTSFEDIYTRFSGEMQKALPLKDLTIFLSGLKSQAGKIKKKEFIRYHSTYALYKTNFEQGVFSLNISLNPQSKINGLYIEPYVEVPQPKRNITALSLPFEGEWTVVWGGDTEDLNYHVESRAQKNAFDFVVTGDSGKTFKTDGATNEDYYAFGKDIIAPADGEVVLVVDGVKDNRPGESNPLYVPGNTVILKTGENEYLFFGHFKQHSIAVEQGDMIKKGDLLGLCGNSGNSSEPHLHFHIQNVENITSATGVKCYFEELLVNGEVREDYSPVKGDKIKPVEHIKEK